MPDDDSTRLLDQFIFTGMRAQFRGRDNQLCEWRMGQLPEALREAYFQTIYRVELEGKRIDIHIMEFTPALDAYLKQAGYLSWAIITAYNPRSRELPSEENQRRQAALRQLLIGLDYTVFPAEGCAPDGSWSEPSLFVPGVSIDFIEAVAAVFEQNAVAYGDHESRAELLFTLDPEVTDGQ